MKDLDEFEFREVFMRRCSGKQVVPLLQYIALKGVGKYLALQLYSIFPPSVSTPRLQLPSRISNVIRIAINALRLNQRMLVP